MVLTLRKQMAHALEFMANYTLSKAIDGGQVSGQVGTFNGTDWLSIRKTVSSNTRCRI